MKLLLPKLALVILIFAAAYLFSHFELFETILSVVEGLGFWAPLFFTAFYILTCVLFFPSLVFAFAAGMIFGLGKGIVLSVVGNGLGAVFAFLIGRYLARERVSRLISTRPEFRKVDEAVRRKGWKIVLLARLSPVFPFMVGNYAFGLTSISAWHYLSASMLGTVPSASVYAYLGTLAGDVAAMGLEDRARTPVEWGLLIAGFFATAALAYYLKRVAQLSLRE